MDTRDSEAACDVGEAQSHAHTCTHARTNTRKHTHPTPLQAAASHCKLLYIRSSLNGSHHPLCLLSFSTHYSSNFPVWSTCVSAAASFYQILHGGMKGSGALPPPPDPHPPPVHEKCRARMKRGSCLQGNFTKLWDPQHRLALSNAA